MTRPLQRTPLYVDMDDTLLAADVTWGAILAALRSHPANLVRVPAWFLRGRPHLKQRVLRWAASDPALLPVHEELLEFLRQEKAAGRRIILATASREELARPVADHIGLFDDVLATRGAVNLKGLAKLRAIEAHAGEGQPFDYAGDSAADLPIWAAARRAYLVDPALSVRRRAERVGNVARVFEKAAPSWGVYASALGLRGWWANLAVFLPLLLADPLGGTTVWLQVAAVFLAFALATSAVRVWEGLAAIDADRSEPDRRVRPFAAGMLSVRFGLAAAVGLLAAGLVAVLAVRVPPAPAVWIAYVVVLGVYRLRFRRVAGANVLLQVLLYANRLLAGAVAAGVV